MSALISRVARRRHAARRATRTSGGLRLADRHAAIIAAYALPQGARPWHDGRYSGSPAPSRFVLVLAATHAFAQVAIGERSRTVNARPLISSLGKQSRARIEQGLLLVGPFREPDQRPGSLLVTRRSRRRACYPRNAGTLTATHEMLVAPVEQVSQSPVRASVETDRAQLVHAWTSSLLGRPAGACFARLAEDRRARRRVSLIRPTRRRRWR